MSEEHSGPVEIGASMDYREHDKTYDLFIAGAKYGTAIIVALMVGTAVLMASLAFSFQRYFEYQIEEARKISQ